MELHPSDVPGERAGAASPAVAGFSWQGFYTLFRKELLRFYKVGFQTIAAPVLTSLLYLLIFSHVLEERVEVYRDVRYTAFLLPGLVMSSAFWVLLMYFALRVTRSAGGALLALLLTIGAGGQGGVHFLARDGWAAALNTDVIQNDTTGDGKIFWFAFLPHVFLPQRGATFAYPLVLLTLLLVWAATDMNVPRTSASRRSLLMHAGAFAALLPLVQAHAFIGVGMIIAVIFVLDCHKWVADLALLWGWIAAGATAAALGGPQMLLFRNQALHGHGGNFIATGWIYRHNTFGTPEGAWSWLPAGGFFRFWWMSLGFAVPLFLAAIGTGAAEVAAAMWAARSMSPARRAELAARHAAAVAAAAGLPAPTAITRAATSAANVAAPGSGRSATTKPSDVATATSSGVSGGSAGLRHRGAASTAAADGDSDESSDGHTRSDEEGRRRGGGAEGVAGDVSLAEHLAYIAYAALPTPAQDVLSGKTPLKFVELDAALAGANECTVTGRGLDTLKLAVGAGVVFLVGNYINFQPWDRDNCKLFYVWLFVYATLAGALLAAPLEALARRAPGTLRMLQVVGVSQATVLDAAAVDGLADRGTGGAVGEKAAVPALRAKAARAVAIPCALLVPVILFFTTLSGLMLLRREYNLYHVMLDEDQKAVAAWIDEHVPPKAVFLHRDIHIVPSGSLSGRPTLVGYTGAL